MVLPAGWDAGALVPPLLLPQTAAGCGPPPHPRALAPTGCRGGRARAEGGWPEPPGRPPEPRHGPVCAGTAGGSLGGGGIRVGAARDRPQPELGLPPLPSSEGTACLDPPPCFLSSFVKQELTLRQFLKGRLARRKHPLVLKLVASNIGAYCSLNFTFCGRSFVK